MLVTTQAPMLHRAFLSLGDVQLLILGWFSYSSVLCFLVEAAKEGSAGDDEEEEDDRTMCTKTRKHEQSKPLSTSQKFLEA